MKALAHAAVLAVVVAALAGTARGRDDAAFTLAFDGHHAPATFASPNGLEHEGTFTTNDPRCASGTAADVAIAAATATARRRFTCSSGETFDALVGPLPFEHGGKGTWKIVGGTGSLAALRGLGRWTSVRTGGSDDDPMTITFTSDWTGVAADDVTPPTVAFAGAVAHRLSATRAQLALTLRVTDRTEPLTFAVTAEDPAQPATLLLRMTGTTTSTSVSASKRIHVVARTRSLRVTATVTDAVGNTRTTSARVRLPQK